MNKQPRAGVVLAAAALTMIVVMLGCSRSKSPWQNRGSPRVVVTIPALDNFVRNVGGEHVGIVCLCTNRGPHQYESSPEDAIVLREADLFFAIGLELDNKFADTMQLESHNPRLQYVKLGDALRKRDEKLPEKDKLLLAMREEHEHGHEHEHEHGHEHGEYDPHIWLGIPQAVALVEMIRDELTRVDEARAAEYDKNAAAYIKKLKALHAYGQEKLKDKKNRKLIAFHESLSYFAKSFDLNIVDVIEVAAGNEPPPEHLAKVAGKCKKEDVHVIAVEPQYPQASAADVLRQQVKDIHFVVVDPLETADDSEVKGDGKGKELKSADWYERKMQQNLDALAKGLP